MKTETKIFIVDWGCKEKPQNPYPTGNVSILFDR